MVLLLCKKIHPFMSRSLRVLVWYRIIHYVLQEMHIGVLFYLRFHFCVIFVLLVGFWHGKIYHTLCKSWIRCLLL